MFTHLFDEPVFFEAICVRITRPYPFKNKMSLGMILNDKNNIGFCEAFLYKTMSQCKLNILFIGYLFYLNETNIELYITIVFL